MEPRWYTVLFWPNRDKNSLSIITKHVINQVKKFLRKSETEFPNKDSYKQLKKEILRIFGPRPETATDLVGPPSSLARELKDEICQHELDCDCCPAVISYLWKNQLSAQVRLELPISSWPVPHSTRLLSWQMISICPIFLLPPLQCHQWMLSHPQVISLMKLSQDFHTQSLKSMQ